MKCISVFLLSAATLCAADFTTGQAARLVIGQTTFTSQDPNSSDTIVGGVSGLAYAADTLFVVDSNRVGASPINHRVLLFKNASSQIPDPTAELDYTHKCPACVGQATVVLGQPDFTTTTENLAASSSALREPTSIASDGVHVVVADTDHNRVLIWNRIPTANDQPADVVVGEPDFVTATLPAGNSPTATSMRGPQGVWIQNGRLYVADTQNNRVLIYNHIPTANGAAADVVLGAPNFTTFVQPDLTQQSTNASATNMLNPVSVTSDGVRLFVTDLGYNRVLVWNTIPSANDAAADFALGQPDLTSSIANNAYTTDSNSVETAVLCTTSNGTDSNGNPTYPSYCNSTLNFPRYALSTGSRLFVADGGNDRVLVYNQIPTQSGTAADYVIGQIGGSVNQASDAADSLRTPLGMAWDGTNLYVSDAYNRRVTVYSMGQTTVPYQGVRNSASIAIFARGSITISGTITKGDLITLEIGTAALSTTTTNSNGTTTTTTSTNPKYTYTVQADDTLATVTTGLAAAINNSNSGAGDPNVRATADTQNDVVILTALTAGTDGNSINYQTTLSTNATIVAAVAASTLTGGGDAASIAPGTIVSIMGTNLSAGTASADLSQTSLPTQLDGTEVYFNGIRAPLYYVSPTQINAQVPWELNDTTSINAFVRSVMGDGSVVNTTPVAVTIVPANPGVFTVGSSGVGVIYHGSSSAVGIISVDGTVTAGDVATVTVEDRSYSYTVQSSDTLDSIRDNLIALINQDPKVTAQAAGVYDRIIITARVEGPEGNGISISGSADASATVIITAFSTTLCCANVAGGLVTPENPAIPGETVVVYATGLGLPVLSDQVAAALQTGVQYPPNAPPTSPQSAVSSIAGGSTADVLSATLMPGTVGMFKVVLHLNSSLPTNSATALTIAQDVYVSNIATFPLVSPADSGTSSVAGSVPESAPAPSAPTTASAQSAAVPRSLRHGQRRLQGGAAK
jgi:phage tail sheath gpL-like